MYARLAECALGGLAGARASFAHEQGLINERLGPDAPALDGEQAGLGDSDDLVRQKRRELDALVDLRFANEGELHSPGEQTLDHLVRRRDLNLDVDVRMVAPEAAERVGEQVDTRRRRGSDVDGSRLETGEQASCLGEAAATTVALHEPLPGRRLEQP